MQKCGKLQTPCMCVIVCTCADRLSRQTEKVKGDFVLSLALTAQTKTKSHKLHDLDHNLLLLALSLCNAETSGSSEGSKGGEGFNYRTRRWVTSAGKGE